MGSVLINCDLGENESHESTQRLLELVDAANICCGFHAGSLQKTAETIQMIEGKELLVGAHPGMLAEGGRGQETPSVSEFSKLLSDQVDSFLDIAGKYGVKVTYVKLHGSLYHAVEKHRELAETYCGFLSQRGLSCFALATGSFLQLAKEREITAFAEGFLDRGYEMDGTLVPRSNIGALLGVDEAVARFRRWQQTGLIQTKSGLDLELRAETLCVHGDSVESETLLARIREATSI